MVSMLKQNKLARLISSRVKSFPLKLRKIEIYNRKNNLLTNIFLPIDNFKPVACIINIF
jgi:hypothetical protein